MSWTVCPEATTKYDVVSELLSDNRDHTLGWELRGCVLWSVLDDISEVPAIVGFLIWDFGFAWAYRPMEEDAGIPYFACPLRLLDLAPAVDEQWRAQVRDYHACRRGRWAADR